jgi:opacity protein-like surface antigen
MKNIIITLVVLVLLSEVTRAQENPSLPGLTPNSYYTLSWNIAFPIGEFKQWVSNASPAGIDFGGRYFIKGGLAAGFNIMWQRVSEKYENETFYIAGGSAITATNYRFTWMVPFRGVIAYHFMADKLFSPYVGLGIGGDYMEHHMLVQDIDASETHWDFSLTPEVGALVKFGTYSSWGALVAFNYKWTTNNIDFTDNITLENIQMLNLKIGLALIIR